MADKSKFVCVQLTRYYKGVNSGETAGYPRRIAEALIADGRAVACPVDKDGNVLRYDGSSDEPGKGSRRPHLPEGHGDTSRAGPQYPESAAVSGRSTRAGGGRNARAT